MSTYNVITTRLCCPRCNAIAAMEVESRFGDTSRMVSLTLGDLYPFRANKSASNGGHPPDDNVTGEGYVVCPSCSKDFFVLAIVRAGILSAVEVDRSREGFIK